MFIHPDVIEVIDNFLVSAKARQIHATVIGLDRLRNSKVDLVKHARASVSPPSFHEIKRPRKESERP